MGYSSPDIQGWMGKPELDWLYEKAKTMNSVVEIGSWKGRSTHALLSGCPGPVFAIDHFKGNPNELKGPHKEATQRDIFPDFWANVGHFRNLVLMRMDSVAAARFFAPKSIDMVFIDGCHLPDAVRVDIESWRPVCRRLFCGHDVNTIKEVLNKMNIRYCIPDRTMLWESAL